MTFLEFIRTQGISDTDLPDDSPDIVFAYDLSNATVLKQIPAPHRELAVNNLGFDILINYSTAVCFEPYRKKYKIDDFVAGVVNSTSDEGTSVSVTNPNWAQSLSLAHLQNLKTPYGRRYLGIVQQFGIVWAKA